MSPKAEALYNIRQDWGANMDRGPFLRGKVPDLPPRDPHRFTFLGHGVNSLFGVAACPLTADSRYVTLASQLGNDVITYKSVRSVEWGGNEFPHWLYADVPRGTNLEDTTPLVASFDPFEGQEASMVNSFGIHSLPPSVWQWEFRLAQQQLLPGQLLILSVQTTPIEGKTQLEDAQDVARLGLAAGAQVFETNLACPNTAEGQSGGMIFQHTPSAVAITKAIKDVIGDKPLLAKVGFYSKREDLKEFLRQTRGILSGISSTNTFSKAVVGLSGEEIFPGRKTAGLSGPAIRERSMEQAKLLVELRDELHLKDFAIIGIGGVTRLEDIKAYFDIGVDAVQRAVGAYTNTDLAAEYLRTLS